MAGSPSLVMRQPGQTIFLVITKRNSLLSSVTPRDVRFSWAVPQGEYLFCDEIEISAATGTTSLRDTLSLENVRQRSLKMQVASKRRGVILGLLEELRKQSTLDFQGVLDSLERQIAEDCWDSVACDTREHDLFRLRARLLALRHPGTSLIVQRFPPWAPLGPADSLPSYRNTALRLTMPVGGIGVDGLLITNPTLDTQTVFREQESPSGRLPIKVCEAGFVTTAAGVQAADVIIPVNGAALLPFRGVPVDPGLDYFTGSRQMDTDSEYPVGQHT